MLHRTAKQFFWCIFEVLSPLWACTFWWVPEHRSHLSYSLVLYPLQMSPHSFKEWSSVSVGLTKLDQGKHGDHEDVDLGLWQFILFYLFYFKRWHHSLYVSSGTSFSVALENLISFQWGTKLMYCPLMISGYWLQVTWLLSLWLNSILATQFSHDWGNSDFLF